MRPGITLLKLFEDLCPQVLTSCPWEELVIHELTLDPLEVSEEIPMLMIARTMWYRDTHHELELVLKRGAQAILVSDVPSTALLHLAQNQKVPIFLIPKEDPTLGLISSKFYDHPTHALKVYGVTGTNGKTSTVSYLAELLEATGERVAVMGTVEYRFETQRLSAPNTTPDALVIHRFARDALDLGATALALEVSSHALTLARVAGVAFDAVGFTNLSRDHLDFHGSMEDYRNAKGALFEVWLKEALEVGKKPSAVVYEGMEGEGMLARCPEGVPRIYSRAIRVEESINAELACEKQSLVCQIELLGSPTVTEMQLRATLPDGHILPTINIPLIGDYHPSNLAVAFGMLWSTHDCEIKRLEQAWASLKNTRGVKGRMELAWAEEKGRRRVALVDYAHTPEAVTRALEALRSVHQGPIWVALGCGGDRDRGKRPAMAHAALALSDRLFLTSDNPRSEDPQQILMDAYQALNDEERTRTSLIIDRRQAIDEAWRMLPTQGALLIAGKGHESYQEYVQEGQKKRFAFSDSESIRACALAEQLDLQTDELPYVKSLKRCRKPSVPEVIYEASLRQRGLRLLLWVAEGDTQDQLDEHTLDTLWIDVKNFEDALELIQDGLKPRHAQLKLCCSDQALFERLYQYLQEELKGLIYAHRGARAFSADVEEGGFLTPVSSKLSAQYIRAGWIVGGANTAYIPSLVRHETLENRVTTLHI